MDARDHSRAGCILWRLELVVNLYLYDNRLHHEMRIKRSVVMVGSAS